MTYAPVLLEDKQVRAYWEAYKGAKIRPEDWDNRQPVGPYLVVGKDYAVFRHVNCKTHHFVEVQDEYGKFTIVPACHFKTSEGNNQ